MTASRLGRPALKQPEIVSDLRRRIVAGKLVPASRLPTRREMAGIYGTSVPTVQLALAVLIHDGFIVARGNQGTFVADLPPHLTHYALVFPHRPGGPRDWPHFWTALQHEAARIQAQGRIKVTCFYGIDGHSDNQDFQTLVEHVHAHRIAGLMFASPPFLVRGTPLLDEPGIPRAGITGIKMTDPVVPITFSASSFMDKAIEYLASRGRHRIAFLTPPNVLEYTPELKAQLAARKMVTKPQWMQSVNSNSPVSATNLMRLLFDSGQKERPDALIINDDNLVQHATAGLVESQIKIPEELDVIGHCNFPWPLPSVVPIKRLGYDAPTVLATLIEAVDAQRAGTLREKYIVNAIFEDELENDPGNGTSL